MRDTFIGVAVTAAVIMPVSVLGAAAPFIRAELSIGEGALGLLVGLFFLSGTVASMLAGRLSWTIGLNAMMTGACALSTLALVAVSGWAFSWWSLALCLAVGGVANAVGQVAVNQWLATRRPLNRQGLAFGAKQAAVPLAALAAGLLLPVVIVPWGWRAGFLAAAVVCAPVIVGLIGVRQQSATVLPRVTAPSRAVTRGPMALLMFIGFLGAAGGTCLAPFLVDYAISRGVSPDAAGLLLAAGAASGIGARLLAGAVADVLGFWPLSIIAGLLVIGGGGIAMLSVASSPIIWVAAVALAFAGAWGWPGLLPLALSRASADTFTAGVGMIVMGPLAGAVVGPSLFGMVVQYGGYAVGWIVLTLFVWVAAALALAVRARSASLHPPSPT